MSDDAADGYFPRPHGLRTLELGKDIEGPADVLRAVPWLLEYVPGDENGEWNESRRIIARLEAGMASGDARAFGDGLAQGYFRPPDWVPRANMPRPPSGSTREASERLLVACCVGDSDIVRGLLEEEEGPTPEVNTRSPRMDLSPLMLAADGGHAGVARLLVSAGADINAQCDGLGFTALHWACRALSVREPWCESSGEMASRSVRTAQELCRTGQCDRGITDETGWTAHAWAVHSGSYSTVDFLDQYEAMALLAARQRLCLALMSHARAARDSPARLLPGRADGGCDLIACGSGPMAADGRGARRGVEKRDAGAPSVVEHLPFARGEGGWWGWKDAERLHARAARAGEIVDESAAGSFLGRFFFGPAHEPAFVGGPWFMGRLRPASLLARLVENLFLWRNHVAMLLWCLVVALWIGARAG
jgi:hypothetical protein